MFCTIHVLKTLSTPSSPGTFVVSCYLKSMDYRTRGGGFFLVVVVVMVEKGLEVVDMLEVVVVWWWWCWRC